MADFLPGWWKGPQYLDIEDVFAQHFQKLLPDVRICHWVDPDWYVPRGYIDVAPTYGTEPTLRLWRQPGQRDHETSTDGPLLQFAAVTRSHKDSVELIEFVDTVMNGLNQGAHIVYNGQRVRVKNMSLWLGPQTIPEGPIDEFFVPVTYKFLVDGLKLQPNYRQILDSLND